ncbi:FAD-dependent oxidoreductase [Phragmitibacter flavus]|uniref:FAD-dependent oxidoreductase n=1 Tax=Phragmitibacter flavus TaxID=2576071 RepID=A0A5R8KKN2_9BACT|nr:NAD(P)/FAD-dependent oxidoreductase [Phragmitibacter flavus]TLD72169.1 FAD-dependent oxidoreductase [Phragmitibacter flavus]
MDQTKTLEVVIVGAGAAGLGCAVALRDCGVKKLLVLERDGVGSSFRKWPKQMRLITPSFYSNPFKQTDLNAITPQSSLADFVHKEHPSGEDYANYLRACVGHYQVPVEVGVEVLALTPHRQGWSLMTNRGELQARFVIWAAGEFSQPHDGGIRGGEHCLHNSQVKDWSKLEGDTFTLVGGYESGIDAAIHLAWRGKQVNVLSRGEPWHDDDPDPSRSLSPFTRDRLREALEDAPGTIRFYKNAVITEVRHDHGGWRLLDDAGNVFDSVTQPILCTGFHKALAPVKHLFAEHDGQMVFSEDADESTLHEGLFYSGPSLSHRQSLFCFIYKFRSRFGIIARAIAERLGLPWEEPLQAWREHGFMVDDLSCCTDCQCAVNGENDEIAEAVEFAGAGEK